MAQSPHKPSSKVNSALVEIITHLRETTPLVQCLTNSVVMETTANMLLAAGASPAMCDTPAESRGFATVASGVLINPGTPSNETYGGMREAIVGAQQAGTPWVLDPVACGGLKERTDFERWAARQSPTAIRGNASEITALLGAAGGRGVDATESVESAARTGYQLAQETGAVVAISGDRDLIISPDGQGTWLRSGHPMMQQVIGTGCSLGALVAAYLGCVESLDDPNSVHIAVLAAHAHTGAAGQRASEIADTPGSFRTAWIDALYQLSAQEIANAVEIERVTL